VNPLQSYLFNVHQWKMTRDIQLASMSVDTRYDTA